MDRFPAVYFSTILHNFSAHSLRARRRSGYAPRLTTPSEEKVSSLSSRPQLSNAKGSVQEKNLLKRIFFVCLLEVFLQSE